MRLFLIGLAMILLTTGCSSTNISSLVSELAKDPAANCIIVQAGPYGGVTLARGTPNVSVSVSASGCSIEGSGVTRVTVPTGSVQVVPK